MVALASWIESEESAVADARPRLGELDPPAENRIRRFFPETPNRVGETPPQVADRVGVLLLVEVRPRRAPSLARSNKPQASKGKYDLLGRHPESLDDLKKAVRWQKGDTVVFSMERKMGRALGLLAISEDPIKAAMNLNTIHEQMFTIDASGNLSNFGFFSTNGGEIRAETFAIDFSKQSWELAGPVYTFSGDQLAYVQDVAFKQLDQLYTGNYSFLRQNCQDYCSAFRNKIE